MKLSLLSPIFAARTALSSVLDARAVVSDCLAASNITVDVPGTDAWTLDATVFNSRIPFVPLTVAVPSSIEQVQAAVACGVKHGVKVTPKCGGHSWANFGFGGEDGHLIVELDQLHKVTLDNKTNIAIVQGGSRLGHVAYELYNQGKRAISHGTCPG